MVLEKLPRARQERKAVRIWTLEDDDDNDGGRSHSMQEWIDFCESNNTYMVYIKILFIFFKNVAIDECLQACALLWGRQLTG